MLVQFNHSGQFKVVNEMSCKYNRYLTIQYLCLEPPLNLLLFPKKNGFKEEYFLRFNNEFCIITSFRLQIKV